MYYRINSPNVVREYFDGEVVVVNLETGTYFSVENVGAVVWAMLEEGHNLDEVVSKVSSSFGKPDQEVRSIIEKFILKLLDQGLIIASIDKPAVIPEEVGLISKVRFDPARFTEPEIKKYTDMQDLLLLDPIHDVDSSGWPVAKQLPK